MAVGAYIYVGKSRLRKKNKERRWRRKEESRRRSQQCHLGVPVVNSVLYGNLALSYQNGDGLSLLGDNAEADSCSTSSSDSEDLIPLIDYDLALDLRPHKDKHLPRLKMPFEFFDIFKRKDKRESETTVTTEENVNASHTGEGTEKPDVTEKKEEVVEEHEETPKESPEEPVQSEDTVTPEENPDQPNDEEPNNTASAAVETVTMSVNELTEDDQESKQPEETTEGSNEADTADTAANGKVADELRTEPLILNDDAQNDNAKKSGILCCVIL